jgi:protein translocase SecG subunit
MEIGDIDISFSFISLGVLFLKLTMSPFLVSLFIFQMLICALLITVVLLQSSDEDALSNITSGSGKFGSTVKRSSIDSATRITMMLGALLMLNSIVLAMISARRYSKSENIIKNYLEQQKKSNDIVIETKEAVREVVETTGATDTTREVTDAPRKAKNATRDVNTAKKHDDTAGKTTNTAKETVK